MCSPLDISWTSSHARRQTNCEQLDNDGGGDAERFGGGDVDGAEPEDDDESDGRGDADARVHGPTTSKDATDKTATMAVIMHAAFGGVSHRVPTERRGEHARVGEVVGLVGVSLVHGLSFNRRC